MLNYCKPSTETHCDASLQIHSISSLVNSAKESFVLKKTKQKFIYFLKQGMSPSQLAVAVTLGICLGIIPLLGATSILCMLAAFSFRLNMAAIQTVNYIIYPLQLLLYIPFLKAGAYIGGQEFKYSLSDITTMVYDHPWETIQKFFVINMYAILLWLLVVVVVYFVFYTIFLKTFQALAEAIQKSKNSEI